MEERLIYILVFGAGTLAQAVFCLGGNFSFATFGQALLLALLAFMPGKHERNYDPYLRLAAYFVAFSCAIAWLFRKALAPISNIKVVLSYQFTLLYAFFTYLYQSAPIWDMLAGLMLAPALLVMVYALFPVKPGRVAELSLYAWHLISALVTLAVQFSFGNLGVLFTGSKPEGGLLSYFFTGMTVFIGAMYLTYLSKFLPSRGKRESFEHYEARRRYEMGFMLSRYDETARITLPEALLIIGGQGLFFYGMHSFGISPVTAINMAIIVPTFLVPKVKPEEAAIFDGEKPGSI